MINTGFDANQLTIHAGRALRNQNMPFKPGVTMLGAKMHHATTKLH